MIKLEVQYLVLQSKIVITRLPVTLSESLLKHPITSGLEEVALRPGISNQSVQYMSRPLTLQNT